MTMTKKIWIIEADNSEYWSEPIIKYSAKEAKDYVRKGTKMFLNTYLNIETILFLTIGKLKIELEQQVFLIVMVITITGV